MSGADLDRLFALQRAAFARERYPDLRTRLDRLSRLKSLVTENEARFAAAVDSDFGDRSEHETRLAELYIVAAEVADAQASLARWMRHERVVTPLHLQPARARIERQPLGNLAEQIHVLELHAGSGQGGFQRSPRFMGHVAEDENSLVHLAVCSYCAKSYR